MSTSRKMQVVSSRKKTGSMVQVYRGTADQTSGGLTKKDILRKRNGDSYMYVSKKKSALSKHNLWIQSVMEAREKLEITGFMPVRKGTIFYDTAKAIHDEHLLELQ
jgi:hypothetical protein